MSRDGIEAVADAAERGHEIGEPFEGEVLAVERNQHGIGGDERVEREEAERRRRVDEDVVEAIGAVVEAVDDRPEPMLAVGERHELDLGTREVAIGGDQGQIANRRLEDEGRGVGGVSRQGVVDAAAGGGLAFEADPAGEVALRVEVDEQDALACERERGAEVDGGGGFADAAFLIGDDEDASHFWYLTKPCV